MKAVKTEQVTENKKPVGSAGITEAKPAAKNSKEPVKKEAVKKEPEPVKTEAIKAEPAKMETPKAAKAEPAPAKEKAPVKKASVKKAAVKASVKPAVKEEPVEVSAYIQYAGKEISQKDLTEKVKAIWTGELGKKEKDLKSVKLYIKPEELAVYYVINGEETGKIDF